MEASCPTSPTTRTANSGGACSTRKKKTLRSSPVYFSNSLNNTGPRTTKLCLQMSHTKFRHRTHSRLFMWPKMALRRSQIRLTLTCTAKMRYCWGNLMWSLVIVTKPPGRRKLAKQDVKAMIAPLTKSLQLLSLRRKSKLSENVNSRNTSPSLRGDLPGKAKVPKLVMFKLEAISSSPKTMIHQARRRVSL